MGISESRNLRKSPLRYVRKWRMRSSSTCGFITAERFLPKLSPSRHACAVQFARCIHSRDSRDGPSASSVGVHGVRAGGGHVAQPRRGGARFHGSGGVLPLMCWPTGSWPAGRTTSTNPRPSAGTHPAHHSAETFVAQSLHAERCTSSGATGSATGPVTTGQFRCSLPAGRTVPRLLLLARPSAFARPARCCPPRDERPLPRTYVDGDARARHASSLPLRRPGFLGRSALAHGTAWESRRMPLPRHSY